MGKRIIVCGGNGFIGSHLVKRLRDEGNFVISIDRKAPEFDLNAAQMNRRLDLRYLRHSDDLFRDVDEVYQLAAEMGGMGFIGDPANDYDILQSSASINLNVLEACRHFGVPRIFYASSACVYPDTGGPCVEHDAYPAHPDSEYGWEKLFSERLYQAFGRNFVRAVEVRIGRYHNVYGPFGTYKGGREKAPAALMRKVAESRQEGHVEIWGDGRQRRSFMYIDDAIEGTIRLMRSSWAHPLNIGSTEMVTINQLANQIALFADKKLVPVYVEGPKGVDGRNSDNQLIKMMLRWEPSISLCEGIAQTYPWIAEQVRLDKLNANKIPSNQFEGAELRG